MINIYIQSTHSKIDYDEATDEELAKSEDILLNSFLAIDSSLLRDPRVVRGIMSAAVSFYIQDKHILPTGLTPYYIQLLKKNNLEFTQIEMRKFPKPDLKFLEDVIKDKYSVTDKVETDENGNLKVYTPRDFQKEALVTIASKKIGIIQLPMGSGKGFLVALIARLYPDVTILCLFDQVELLWQTYDNLTLKYGFDQSEVGVIQGNNKQKGRIVLLSIQSYENAFHIFPRTKVIISDECHHTGRNETSLKIIYACQNAPIHVGLSATPDCLDNPAEQMRLYATMGPIIYKKEFKKQMDDGVIAQVELNLIDIKCDEVPVCGNWADIYETIKIKSTEQEMWTNAGYEIIYENQQYYARKFLDYGDESNHYVYNKERNQIIADIAKSHERVLILFNRKEHGRILRDLIPNSVMISGDDDKDTRKKAEIYLKENSNAVVLASKIWGTGKDIPEIFTLINAGGGVSQVEQIQKMGRAVRISEKLGKYSAKVFDFFDHFSPLAVKQSKKRLKTYEKLGLTIIQKGA